MGFLEDAEEGDVGGEEGLLELVGVVDWGQGED